MPTNNADHNVTQNLRSPRVILSVLSSIFSYTARTFPRKIILFLFAKVFEFIFQLVTVGLFAVTVQLKFSENGDLQNTPFSKFLKHPLLDGFFNLPTAAIFALLTVIILFNVFFAFLCRRILTRIAVDVEYHLSSEVMKSAKDLKFSQYMLLNQVFAGFNKLTILRFIQQNTRLVGIVARNLISALFSVLQLAGLFIVFWFFGYKAAPVLLMITFAVAGLSLIWLFRIGIAHSINFPASAAAAGKARADMLSKTLSSGYAATDAIHKDYFENAKIANAIKHYEDRFKIIDIGSFIINLITSAALIILIMSFFGAGNTVNTTLLIAILFIGNIVLRSVQQLSSFFVIIGRLYSQVWEVWAYQAVVSDMEESANVSDALESPEGFISFADSESGDELKAKAGDILALCQHEEIGKIALFKFMSQSSSLSDVHSPLFENMIVADKDYLDGFLEVYPRDVIKSLHDNFETCLSGIDKDEVFDRDSAFTVFAHLTLSEGLVLAPISYLKDLSVSVLGALYSMRNNKLLIFYGRSPDRTLRAYQELIETIILVGNQIRVLPTEEALKLTGEDLRAILNVTHSGGASGDNDLNAVDDLH